MRNPVKKCQTCARVLPRDEFAASSSRHCLACRPVVAAQTAKRTAVNAQPRRWSR